MAENFTCDAKVKWNNDTLLKSMLPITVSFETPCYLMPTAFTKSSYWRSLLIVGQNQLQRNGLLLQAALTHASLNKQVMFIMKKEFVRFPPTTHGMTPLGPESMVNITFKYCQNVQSLVELFNSFSKLPTEQLPDVIIVNGLNEYQESPANIFYFSKTLSILLEATNYVGQQKQSTGLLFVSLALAKTTDQVNLIPAFQQWIHEVWTLEGTSNRLVSGNIHIQFTVLSSNIFLKTISKIDSTP